MLLQRVAFGQHGGHAALSPAAGAVAEFTLGQQRHAVCRRQQQCGRQPGQTAADDENVKIEL